MILNLLILVALLYGGACLYLYLNQRKFIFPGAVVPTMPEPPSFYLPEAGAKVKVWQTHTQQQKALIYYGGNAEAVKLLVEQYAHELSDYTGYFLNYRGFGGEQGSPSEAVLYQDALAIYDQIASQYRDIVIIGRSLGSGIATYVASQRPVSKVVLITPYDSIENIAKANYWMFPVGWLLNERFRSMQYATQIHVPMLIIRSATDVIVPHERTDALVKVLKPEWVRQVTLAGTDHVNVVDSSDYFPC